jgi:ribosomal protein S18 acetylase RimI-like enzyme
MKMIYLHDKNELEDYLLKYRHLNYYHLGDLDDFFWPYTTWYALKEDGEIKALNLFYMGIDPAVLLGIVNDNLEEMKTLLSQSLPLLPPDFYAHLSPGLEKILEEGYTLDHHGEHYKMNLTDPSKLDGIDTSTVVPLTTDHLEEMQTLYRESYPGNWFDARMVETGQYVGIREEGKLVSVAGIHVYSPVYKIAALGNITTHPARRGQGLGKTVSAGLCKRLLKTVDAIGLNVRSDNAPAIKVYEAIGFTKVAIYHEWMVKKQQS